MTAICSIFQIQGTAAPGRELRGSIQKMLDTMPHRGSDGEDLETVDGLGLGISMRHCLPLDVMHPGIQRIRGGPFWGEHFHQAKDSSRWDCWIAGDVRLDNRSEIITALNSTDPALNNGSDPRLIAELYRHQGVAGLQSLRGDFAYILIDLQNQMLICAVDPFGYRQLRWTLHQNLLIVSTESKALRALYPSAFTLNTSQIGSYEEVQRKPDPETCFSGIQRLMPGTMLLARSQGTERAPKGFKDLQVLGQAFGPEGLKPAIRIHSYFNPGKELGAGPMVRTKAEAQEGFGHFMRQAVQRRTRQLGVTGIEFSGGLDSSGIAKAFLENQANGEPKKMIPLSYYSESILKPNDNWRIDSGLRTIKENTRTGSFLEPILLGDLQMQAKVDLNAMHALLEEPFAVTNTYINQNLAIAGRTQGVTHVLSGLHGDFFCRAGLSSLALLIRRFRPIAFFLNWMEWKERDSYTQFPWELKRMLKHSLDPVDIKDILNFWPYSQIEPMMEQLNITYLPVFHDISLIDFCLRIPAEFSFERGYSRMIQRSYLKNFFDKKLVYQRKKANFRATHSFFMESNGLKSRADIIQQFYKLYDP